MIHIGWSDGRNNDFWIFANEHSDGSSSSSRSGWSFLIDCNVHSHYNSISSIPTWRAHPIKSIEESIGGTIASIDVGDSLYVMISFEEGHKDCLSGLTFVDEGLRADL